MILIQRTATTLAARIRRFWYDPTAIGLSAVALSLVITASALWGRSFPVNDGGFWLYFAEYLAHHGPALPASLPFNGRDLPLAYPPLSAYLLAALNKVLGIGMRDLLLFLPAVLYICNVALVARLVYQLCGNSGWFRATTLAFPLLPYAYRWFIMGGGVSRSLGFTFQIVSWSIALDIALRKPRNSTLLLSFVLALACLTHPNGALWSILGCCALTLGKVQWRSVLMVALVTALLVSPWAILVISRHGLVPWFNAFLSSGQSAGSIFALGDYLGVSPVANGLAFAGMFLTLASRRPELALLWIVGLAVDDRGASLHNGVVLIAIFVGRAVDVIGQALLASEASRYRSVIVVASFCVFLATNELSLNASLIRESRSYMTEPREYEMTALQAIGSELADAYKEVALLSRHPLAGDALGEWLFVLSGLRVRNMHQMAEWHGDFRRILTTQFQTTEACCGGHSSKCEELLREYADTVLLVHRRSCAYFLAHAKEQPRCKLVAYNNHFGAVSCS